MFEHWYASRSFLEGNAGTPVEDSTEEELLTRRDLAFWKARHSPDLTEQLLPSDLEWVVPAAAEDSDEEDEDVNDEQLIIAQ